MVFFAMSECLVRLYMRSTYEGKSPVSFEIWLFRSSQPSGDDDFRMHAAIISTVFAYENHCTGNNHNSPPTRSHFSDSDSTSLCSFFLMMRDILSLDHINHF
jgi:hypothetical protein